MAIEKSKSIGGLYEKVSQKGLDYLNGFITIEGKKIKIVAFKNNNKINDKSPDYSVFISEPMIQSNNNNKDNKLFDDNPF